MKKTILDILGTITGAIIMAFAVSCFLLPNQLSSGGFSGIATIFYYLLKIPMGFTIVAINTPLFILAFYRLGKKFFAMSILGTISLSFFIDIFDRLTPITDDRFLACIYGGVLVGIGTAIVLKSQSSTGGTELITRIINSYNPALKISVALVIIDVIIVALNVLFFREIEIGLYSAIAIYLAGKMIAILFEGVNFTKLIFIISDRNKLISEQISSKVQRGITGLDGKGMYTDESKLVLMCAASRNDISQIKNIAQSIDNNAFIIIANAKEVFGKGFKRK